jgi:hypothetical protein
LRVLYRAEWSDERLRQVASQARAADPAPTNDDGSPWVPIHHHPDGRATIRVDLPPAGMVILA